jgi:hypothetical protein
MRENLATIHRVHPVAPPHLHPHDLLLVVHHHLVLHLVQIKIVAAKIYLHAVALAIVVAQPAMLAKGAKSAIHAGFVQRHKIAINRESVRASSSQIFQMM